jgi:hypothetical protein
MNRVGEPTETRDGEATRARRRRLPWLVALLALLPHLRGLANDFVYDDFRFVVENPGVQTLAKPWELVTSVERASAPADHDVWRPLRTLGLAVEHALFGKAAWGFHLVSLALALLLVRATIALASRLPGVPLGGALAIGLLFGLHPLTVESVAWISSQGDLLCAIGVVLTLLLARERPWLAVTAACLALLAKEAALPLVALLLLARIGCFGEALRARTSVVVATTVATLLFFVARQRVLGHDFSLGAAGVSQVEATLTHRVLQAGQCVVVAIERCFWPWPLSADYTNDPTSLGEPTREQAAVAIGLLAAACVASGWRSVRERGTVPLGSALFFLGLLPTCGLIVAMKSATAERFLLVPTLGLVLVVVGSLASAVTAAARSSALRVASLALVVVALAESAVTWRRTGDFRDTASLWSAEMRVHPGSIQAWLGLAQTAEERGDFKEARHHLLAIVDATFPGDARGVTALFELGRLDFDEQRDADGARWMERCRKEIAARDRVDDLEPQVHLCYVALGNFLRATNGPDAAEAALQEGVARFGRLPRLLEGLGLVREARGDRAGAADLYREALRRSDPAGESPTLRHHLDAVTSPSGRRDATPPQVPAAR